MRVPTRQLEQYGDLHKFSDAARRFASAIVRRSKGYEHPFLVNLHHINEEIGKTRSKGKYVRGTLCIVKEKLFESPNFVVVRKHSAYVFEVKILSFSDSQNTAKTSEKLTAEDAAGRGETQDPQSNLEQESEDAGIDLQHLIYVSQKAASLGLYFGSKGLKIVAQFPKSIVDKVFNHYLASKQRNHIPSPTGWIICNLQQKWYRSFKPEKFFMSAEQKLFELQDWFIENTGSIPRRYDQLNIFRQKKYEPRTTQPNTQEG